LASIDDSASKGRTGISLPRLSFDQTRHPHPDGTRLDDNRR
jgi:hypothetical protein